MDSRRLLIDEIELTDNKPDSKSESEEELNYDTA